MLTNEQLEQRLSCITGSDAAVICGISPYKTRLQLWMEKTRRVEADDISGLNHIKFGNYMEQGVARWFEDDSGKAIDYSGTPMITHKSLPWMAGTIDFLITGENSILECKTAYRDTGWGNGENIIPPYYLMQVAHYCAVGNFEKAYIAVVFSSTREMRWYVYDRNQTLEDRIINMERDFWVNYVQADKSPDPVCESDLLLLYKSTKQDPIIATDDVWGYVEKLKNRFAPLGHRHHNNTLAI